jgi:hypothetical protein
MLSSALEIGTIHSACSMVSFPSFRTTSGYSAQEIVNKNSPRKRVVFVESWELGQCPV